MDGNKIALFAMDVDGTLTDGKIHICTSGELFKSFNVKDGMGIKLLQKQGIITALITARHSTIVENRAKELGILEVHQGMSDKLQIISVLSDKYNIPLRNIAYIGDDVNDIDVMKQVGHSFCPNDSVYAVREIAGIVLKENGGNGAVREATEIILKYNQKA